jgi:hypothetical protein
MPDVKIKLSKLSPKEMTVQALDHPPYIPEEPPGTYQGLEANETYWVYALQVFASCGFCSAGCAFLIIKLNTYLLER